jgi:hypothetical protein
LSDIAPQSSLFQKDPYFFRAVVEIAEAGFVPGIAPYLTYWFSNPIAPEDRYIHGRGDGRPASPERLADVLKPIYRNGVIRIDELF